ncbi:DUF6390 family protein [Patescibacteria group bacterium]
MHVGVGKASGAVPFNLESINNCMIRWGEVTEINGSNITVLLNSMNSNKNNYFINKAPQKFSFVKDFIKDVKVGSIVAVHWQQVIKVLTSKEKENVSNWTEKVIKTILPE